MFILTFNEFIFLGTKKIEKKLNEIKTEPFIKNLVYQLFAKIKILLIFSMYFFQKILIPVFDLFLKVKSLIKRLVCEVGSKQVL